MFTIFSAFMINSFMITSHAHPCHEIVMVERYEHSCCHMGSYVYAETYHPYHKKKKRRLRHCQHHCHAYPPGFVVFIP